MFIFYAKHKRIGTDRAPEDGGKNGSSTVVDMVEEPLMHHLPAVPLNMKV